LIQGKGCRMRRRDFVVGLAGAAAWPVVALAQQGDRMRRIGMLMAFDENDPPAKSLVSAFTQALADLGDESKLIALPAGTFIAEPPKTTHFTWAKDGEVILQVTGIGPSGTTLVQPPKP
jgi:hypothetical protein